MEKTKTTYRIMAKSKDGLPHDVHFSDRRKCTGISNYQIAKSLALQYLKESYPDWDESAIVVDETTGWPCCSWTLRVVLEEIDGKDDGPSQGL